MTVKELFLACLDADEGDRERWLAKIDVATRTRVEALLRAHEGVGDCFEPGREAGSTANPPEERA